MLIVDSLAGSNTLDRTEGRINSNQPTCWPVGIFKEILILDKNYTKLTNKELSEALHLFNGMITYQVKRSLEKVINYVYNLAYEKGKCDAMKSMGVKKEFEKFDPIDLEQLDK